MSADSTTPQAIEAVASVIESTMNREWDVGELAEAAIRAAFDELGLKHEYGYAWPDHDTPYITSDDAECFEGVHAPEGEPRIRLVSDWSDWRPVEHPTAQNIDREEGQ